METNTALLGTGTGGTILGVLLMIYKLCNGKRMRSSCCGYKVEADFKFDDMPPTPPMQENPLHAPNIIVDNK